MFFNPSNFDFVKIFEKNWEHIHQEYRNLDAKILDVHRNSSHDDYFNSIANNNGWIPSWQVGSTEKNYDWLTYALFHQGKFPADVREKFPTLTEILKQIPCIKTCAFSMMKPLSVIGLHRHTELGGDILTFHFGIDIIPGTSFLFANGIFEEEKNMKPLIFDGSQNHFAVNAGLTNRTIMYIEFDKSQLTA